MAVCINELKELPPLSSSAREILKLIHDDDADIGQFSQIVERDPALLLKIIGLANSAFYGTRAVTNVKRAIIDVLGFRMAKNIVLGVVLGGIFNPKKCQPFNLHQFWFVSLMTAILAREITIELKNSFFDANDAYLCGMLNEIGLMALACLYPKEMGNILDDSVNSVFDNENTLFGQNHYDISARLLSDWQLPDVVTNVMLESSQNSPRECSHLCHIVFFTHRLANMIYDNIAIDLAELELPEIISEQSHLIKLIIEKASGQVETYREMADLLC
jgi:HD-like signal output (HDOD) protein